MRRIQLDPWRDSTHVPHVSSRVHVLQQKTSLPLLRWRVLWRAVLFRYGRELPTSLSRKESLCILPHFVLQIRRHGSTRWGFLLPKAHPSRDRHAHMYNVGAVFVKYSKDGKEKHDRHVWLTDNKGKQTIHWTISKPTSPLAVSAKRVVESVSPLAFNVYVLWFVYSWWRSEHQADRCWTSVALQATRNHIRSEDVRWALWFQSFCTASALLRCELYQCIIICA